MLGPPITSTSSQRWRVSSRVWALSRAVIRTGCPRLSRRRTIGANNSGCGELERSIQTFMASVDPPPEHDGGHCAKHQADVGPQGPVGDVEVVEPDHLLERQARSTEHLPEAGQARDEVDPAPTPAVQLAVLRVDQRSWPHEAHLPLEHVPELRQLIEAPMAKESADPRHPRVMVQQEPSRILALGEQLVATLLGVHGHRPELDE